MHRFCIAPSSHSGFGMWDVVFGHQQIFHFGLFVMHGPQLSHWLVFAVVCNMSSGCPMCIDTQIRGEAVATPAGCVHIMICVLVKLPLQAKSHSTFGQWMFSHIHIHDACGSNQWWQCGHLREKNISNTPHLKYPIKVIFSLFFLSFLIKHLFLDGLTILAPLML